MFDIFYKFPLNYGMTPHSSNLTEEEIPSNRVVLIILDGVRADTFFESVSSGKSPFLRNIVTKRGVYGISHSKVPTESSPCFTAICSGHCEYASLMLKDLSDEEVIFDSIFNQTKYSFGIGKDSCKFGKIAKQLECFNKDNYGYDFQDYMLIDELISKMSEVKNNKNNDLYKRLTSNKIAFIIHIENTDGIGHFWGPRSESMFNYLIKIDSYYEKLEKFFIEFYKDDKTTFIITSDHGCDPTQPGTSHTRENVPVIVYSRLFTNPHQLEVLDTLSDIGATILDNFEINENNSDDYQYDNEIYDDEPEEEDDISRVKPHRDTYRPEYDDRSVRERRSSGRKRRRRKSQTAAKVITALMIFIIIGGAAIGIMAISGFFSNKSQTELEGEALSLTSNLTAGQTYGDPVQVVINKIGDGDIYYTLDGSEPAEDSKKYEGPFEITAADVRQTFPDVTLRAVSFAENSEKSGELNVSFHLDYDEAAAAAAREQATTTQPETKAAPDAPVISPVSGTYYEETQILVSAQSGASIYYTYDGTIPDTRSDLYTGPVKMIPGSSVFSAVCVVDGVSSEASSAAYTFETGYNTSSSQAMQSVLDSLLWNGYIYDYNGSTSDGYAALSHKGIYEIGGYTYYVIQVDFYYENGTIKDTQYRGVGVNYGNVYYMAPDGDSFYLY